MVLGVFFTRGVSLYQWVESGLFDREVLIYNYHLDQCEFDEIIWYTYGTSDTGVAQKLRIQNRLSEKIRVVQMPSGLRKFGRGASLIYSLVMPFVLRSEMKRSTVFKTNQMDGALAAVIASRLFKRPLYVRTGYTLSIFFDRIHAQSRLRRTYAWIVEKIAFRCAKAVSVSSVHDLDYAVRRYRPRENQVTIIGNYIDIRRFSPRKNIVSQERIIFVGRLSEQKNLESAIRAVASKEIGLDIIGEGPAAQELKALGERVDADIRWLGTIDNNNLPDLLAHYKYFLLPSLWEGRPKALLEAMAMGMVCIGVNSTGINEIIKNGYNGYLADGPAHYQIAEAIHRAIKESNSSIGLQARHYVCENCSMETIAAAEIKLLKKISDVNNQGK